MFKCSAFDLYFFTHLCAMTHIYVDDWSDPIVGTEASSSLLLDYAHQPNPVNL